MNFLDVKTDFAFKKVFGSEGSKEILISFLNSIIYEDKPVKIKDLTIVDPCNIPMIKGVKDTFVLAMMRAYKLGLQQGLLQGVEHGFEMAKIQIARNLLDVLDDETICLKTGLSMATVGELRRG